MNFVILPSETKMSIDNMLVEVDTKSWVPSDVEIVAWHGEDAKGFIEYNDRPRVTTRIDDLTPYLGAIDKWLDVASKLPEPLQLGQAKQIKMGVVDAIYHNRRLRPYTHGYSYETTDEAIAYMTAVVISTGLIRRFDEAMAGFIGVWGASGLNYNAWLHYQTYVAIDNGGNGWSYQNQSNWSGLGLTNAGTVNIAGAFGPAVQWLTAPTNGGWLAHGHNIDPPPYTAYPMSKTIEGTFNRSINAGSFRTMYSFGPSGFAVPSVASGGVSEVSWQPIGYNAPIGINASSFKDALEAIINHRNWLNEIRVTKKNGIQNSPTMSDVINYPVAVGWP